MPIRLDALPLPTPGAMTLPNSLTVSLPMHSTGTADTRAFIRYSIDPNNDACFTGGTKVVTSAVFIVPVPPGVVHVDMLSLVRCSGSGFMPVNLPIVLEVQECDAAGSPIGIPDRPNVTVQIL